MASRQFTGEEVGRLLKEAAAVVDASGVADDLRVSAFERAFAALAGLGAPAAGADVARVGEVAGGSGDDGAQGQSLASIASRFGVPLSIVEDAYYIDGDSVALSIAPSRFNAQKAAGTKQIALLTAAARQGGGWEEWTSVQPIRDATREYGRFDSSNFAATIKDMGDAFNLRGRGHQAEIRVTRPGYERAAQLLRELVQAS